MLCVLWGVGRGCGAHSAPRPSPLPWVLWAVGCGLCGFCGVRAIWILGAAGAHPHPPSDQGLFIWANQRVRTTIHKVGVQTERTDPRVQLLKTHAMTPLSWPQPSPPTFSQDATPPCYLRGGGDCCSRPPSCASRWRTIPCGHSGHGIHERGCVLEDAPEALRAAGQVPAHSGATTLCDEGGIMVCARRVRRWLREGMASVCSAARQDQDRRGVGTGVS